MSMDAILRIEKMRGHKFSEKEATRLRKTGNALNLRDDDALWPLLAALEYQRIFYEALPGKIAAASSEVMKGIAATAEKESAAAQAKLTESVVEQAKRLSTKIQYSTLLPMGIGALICLLAYGSFLMWAGYSIRSGQTQLTSLPLLLQMPVGWPICGLCLIMGLVCAVVGGKYFAEANAAWIKFSVVALGCLIFAFWILSFVLF